MKREILSENIYLYTDVYKNNLNLYNTLRSYDTKNWIRHVPEDLVIDSPINPRGISGQFYSTNLTFGDVEYARLQVFKIQAMFLSVVNDYFLGKFDKFRWYDDVEIMKYSTGDFFDNHSDSLVPGGRKYSIFYYINDDYVGGELNFTELDIKIKPKKNSIIIFPSNSTYQHKVEPILYGEKYVLATFLR